MRGLIWQVTGTSLNRRKFVPTSQLRLSPPSLKLRGGGWGVGLAWG